MTKICNLIGANFYRWTVISRAKNAKNGKAQWNCKCECGSTKIVSANTLKSGRSHSCGCWNSEVARKRAATAFRTHGLSGGLNRDASSEYRAWCSMMSRCANPNATGYEYYGGRGIEVCKRWLIPENFLADMGTKPSPTHSLDRINNNGNYEPRNCRWATPLEQTQNRRPRSEFNFSVKETVPA
jgi:hypothetical protein